MTIHYRLINARTQPAEAESLWREMQNRCPHSYFNSWGWISSWLATLPEEIEVRLIVALEGDTPLAAFFAGCRVARRLGVWPTRLCALNASSLSRLDRIYVEYNRVLIDPGLNPDWVGLWSAVGRWDEFILSGLAADFVQQAGLLGGRLRQWYVVTEKVENTYWVDLDAVRAAEMDYLRLLSANRRSQIRRSLRQYEQEGPLSVREAESAAEALDMLERLRGLHQKRWEQRNRPGAFAETYFRRFHERLIRERFSEGEIQLLEISAAGKPLGYLYNFVYQGKVLFYQSGFNYGREAAHRPGLVSHYLAVLHNARLGRLTYDFLAGEAQYKASLATDSAPMYWMRLLRGRGRFAVAQFLLTVRRWMEAAPALRAMLKRLQCGGPAGNERS